MAPARTYLRRTAAAWIAVQAVLLLSLVPRDCCASHRPAPAARCHQTAAARQCPMRAANGTPCPMHRDSDGPSGQRTDDCSIRGTCGGPMAALLTRLSQPTILTDSAAVAQDTDHTGDVLTTHRTGASRLDPPDSPPPRA